MRVEFPQGIPNGCTQWLRENVGIGNVEMDGKRTQQWMIDVPEYAWFYERIKISVHPYAFGDDPVKYVPTITVKDPKMAMWFKLRWCHE
jgi:hypothetical protein